MTIVAPAPSIAVASIAHPLSSSTRVLAWSQLGDETLARRAAAGNDAAFTALYERYHGRLLGYCRSILLDAEDADDATQSALERALRALPARDAGLPLRPWLYRIAHNEAITILRRRRFDAELSPDTEPAVAGPEFQAEQRGRLKQLVEDLCSLPERQRGALVMRELGGLSYAEIGGALGLTEPNVRRAVFDARSALHEDADGRETECAAIRRTLSDGDRRRVRARGIRAHLRSCDQCRSFQSAIGARRAELPALAAPWLGGAAAASMLGLGSGAAGGGGALTGACGAGTLTGAGGGLGWSALTGAAKALAIASAVATTGAAATIQMNATGHSGSGRGAAIASPPSGQLAKLAATAAAQAAARGAERARGAALSPHPSPESRPQITPHHDKPMEHAPTPVRVPSQPPPPRAPGLSQQSSAAENAAQLARIPALIDAAIAQAQAAAATGRLGGRQQAARLIASTVESVRPMIQAMLPSVGLGTPSSLVGAAIGQGADLSAAGVAAPDRRMLGAINALLRQPFGRG